MTRSIRIIVLLLIIVVALRATAFATKGFGLIETDPQVAAMHGGAAALITSPAAARINPANLTFIGATTAETTVMAYDVTSEFTSPTGAKMRSEKPWKPAGSVFAATPLSPDLVLGIGLDTPYGTSMRWPAQGLFKYSLPYSGDLRMFDLVTSLGFKASDTLRFGVELDVFRATLNLKQFYPWFAVTGSFATPDGNMEFDGHDTCVSGGVGVSWTPAPQHHLALVAHLPTAIRFTGDFTITNIPVPLPGVSARSDFTATLRMPGDVTLSYAWDVSSTLTLGAEAEWIGNSVVDKLSANVRGNNILFPSTVTPLNWRNSGAFSLGCRQQLSPAASLLLGYQYTTTPMNTVNYTPLIPGNNRQLFSAGFVHTSGQFTLALSYNYGLHPDLHVTNNAVPAFNGTHQFGTHVFTASAAWRF